MSYLEPVRIQLFPSVPQRRPSLKVCVPAYQPGWHLLHAWGGDLQSAEGKSEYEAYGHNCEAQRDIFLLLCFVKILKKVVVIKYNIKSLLIGWNKALTDPYWWFNLESICECDNICKVFQEKCCIWAEAISQQADWWCGGQHWTCFKSQP